MRQRRAPAAATDGPGISHGDIADHNLRTVLELLRRKGPLVRRDLSERLGLSEPALTTILRRLADDGLVTARRQATAERYPATEFLIVPEGAVALGLRLLPERAEILLLDLGGRVLAERRNVPPGGAVAAGQALLAGTSSRRCLGVGVVAGPAQAVPLAELSAAFAPLPVLAAPDAAAAATAERMLGAGEREGSLVTFLLTEDGVRAGLSINGRPFSGHHGRAGGIGPMLTGPDRAPLAERVSLAALRGYGPDAAAAWAADAARHLLDAAIAVSGLLAPGVLVVGGDLPAGVIDLVIAEMERERDDTVRRPMASPWMPPIVTSVFPGGGIVLGAALLPFLEFVLPNPQAVR